MVYFIFLSFNSKNFKTQLIYTINMYYNETNLIIADWKNQRHFSHTGKVPFSFIITGGLFMQKLIVFAIIGFFAQLIDGALGMAYGVT
ncbi:sulfite exporter TauE/SafE family protein, partial [Bacillus thuringiensis]|nr:sulfite exporter TauE/SafE family protein [Bacillus thuringiensis]